MRLWQVIVAVPGGKLQEGGPCGVQPYEVLPQTLVQIVLRIISSSMETWD